jgi:dTDP-4-amino-4,6-dideoxygalactose transaminase
MGKLIPFNVPYVADNSKQYVQEVLESNHQQGDGPFTSKASKLISDLVGGGHVLLTPSCTHALEMASMLANIGPGDEVILPSYTFTSGATAVTKFGANAVFVDIEMQTKGIDVNQVRAAITPRTKAISWVNYAGVPPDIEGLLSIAEEFGLLLIEDNAHGLGGEYKGKPLGSFGDFATQSFHATKNIQCGEGGALIVNNRKFLERAEIIREKGTDRSRFIRGEVQKYQWVDQGSSYLMAEVLSAILYGQMSEFSKIQSDRLNSWKTYASYFTNSYSSEFAEKQVAHMFFLELESENERLRVINELKDVAIFSSFHYSSLADSKFSKKMGYPKLDTPMSLEFSNTVLRLPMWYGMGTETLSKILNALDKIRPNIKLN